MKKLKNIAVITADVFNEYINKILSGINDQSQELGYNVFVFMMTFNADTDSRLQYGEENIYNLINSESIDGVIFICGNIYSRPLIDKLSKKLSDLKIPIVSVDCETEICESLNAEDTTLFEMITDHLIEQHKCHDIMCLTGFKETPQSHTRLLGYKNSLKKHNIPIRDDLIIFGDFWKMTAKQLAEDFLTGKQKLPDAVVCANDLMAITLCNSLVNNGIRVPEDILISGYDGSKEAIENVPSITTIHPLNHDLGARSVCYLHEKITGKTAQLINTQKGFIITAQSCGCGEEAKIWIEKKDNLDSSIQYFDTMYRSCGMTERLLEAEKLDELLNNINNFCYLINGLEIFGLCLCENWDNIESDNEAIYIREGYSENMSLKMLRYNNDFYIDEFKFKSKEILPEKILEFCPNPSLFFLLPLHFEDRCFGYSILKFQEVKNSLNTLYAMWCRNIDIALEFLRVRTKLISINQRTFISSIRDTLTGIYNHKGFKRFSESIFKTAKVERKKLFVLVADLDMLKYINDNFGHIEGDNAITVVANALNKCCQNNEICARIGGDEYTTIGCYDYTDDIINKYIEFINEYFERYNATSEKPYKVEASIGYFCGVPKENSVFQDYFNIADKRMYQNKFERKKFRSL